MDRPNQRRLRSLAAGVLLLSGCADQSPAPDAASPVAARVSVTNQHRERADNPAVAPIRLAANAIIPTAYPFDDPPLPFVPTDTVPTDTVPADSVPADTVPADTVPADSVPADSVPEEEAASLPRETDGTWTRLPPVDAVEERPVDPRPRYEVNSPYSMGRAPDAEPRRPARIEAEAITEGRAFPESETFNAPPLSATSPRGSASAVTRLPPLVPPLATRPSEMARAEARPVGRFERLPPVSVVASPPTHVAAENVSDAEVSVVTAPRHRELDLINEQANACNARAHDLASRGAMYSAQAEFNKALRLIASALDAHQGTATHVASLAAGMAALDEAEDFLAQDAVSGTGDVASIVARHRTPLFKRELPANLTAIAAAQRYFSFAQEQLAAAVEREPAASGALFGMGKLQTALAGARTGGIVDAPKAIVFHQAALFVDSRNHMAANELGVLLARCGRYDAARAALQHSLSIAPSPTTWNNLAHVHEKLGERDLAAKAKVQATVCSKTRTVGGDSPVVWLETNKFAESARPQADLLKGPANPTPAGTTGTQAAKKGGWNWPWK